MLDLPCQTRFSWILVAALALFLNGGCGSSSAPASLVPVKGHVTVEDAPLTGGFVGLHPDADQGNKLKGVPWGRLDKDGNYTVFFEGKAGAPAGAYKVTVLPPTDLVGTRPGRKYEKVDDTDLKIEVSESPPSGAYDLKLKR